MAYVFVESFAAGLDVRKARVAGTPGSLYVLKNAHITRGGRIERRKKFVSDADLPANSFGLHALNDTQYVFGSVAQGSLSPALPAGYSYQRLQHPGGSASMTDLICAENFGGKIYAIAEYSTGEVFHFYDGTIVSDWLNGIVRADMTNTAGIAEHLKALIDADTDYSASRSSSVITITGPVGEAFTVTTEATNGGATNDQTAVAATTTVAVAGVAETLSSVSFTITAGTASTAATGTVTLTGGGSGSVDSVTVNGVTITSGAVAYNTSLNQTASDLAANINAHTSSPDYTASAVGAAVTISAAQGVGAGANGFAVAASTTTITTSTANMSGGVSNGVSSITVDGVEILSTPVNYTSSGSILAANIATQIGAYTSSPDYTATSSNAVVTVKGATGSGATPNGKVITVTTTGTVTVTGSGTAMAGGVAAVSGQAQVSTVTIGGTFDAGDRFTVILEKGGTTKRFGASGNPEAKGVTALTFKSKLYSTAASKYLFFSGVNGATVWNRENIDSPGANFIDMSAQDQGSQTLTGLAVYQGNLAVFARRVIQIWSMDADEEQNVFLQPIKDTGTLSPKSVLSYGNNDVFYYDADSGVRSLRARDSSNAAFVSDVGTAIDTLIRDYADTLTDDQIAAAVAVIEPREGRYWLALGSRIFVLSYFPGSKISAWSYYDTTDDIGADISAWAKVGNQLYCRAGNTAYVYGGADGDTYPDDDECVVEVELPFLSASTPGTVKNMQGFDMAGEGVWDVYIKVDPANTAVEVHVGMLSGTTYAKPRQTLNTSTTHFAPRLRCTRAGYAAIDSVCVHYLDPNEAG